MNTELTVVSKKLEVFLLEEAHILILTPLMKIITMAVPSLDSVLLPKTNNTTVVQDAHTPNTKSSTITMANSTTLTSG